MRQDAIPLARDGSLNDRPLGTFPRRVPGRAPDGRRWEVFTSTSGISVEMAAATVAEAHVWERQDDITIEFWVDGADLPDTLSAELVGQAFAHPSVHAHRPILVCLPRRDGALLQHVLGHLDDPCTRAAGMTCLIEGTVREDPPAPSIPHPRSG